MKNIYTDVFFYDKRLLWINAIGIGIPLVAYGILMALAVAVDPFISEDTAQALGWGMLIFLGPVVSVGVLLMGLVFFLDLVSCFVFLPIHMLKLLRAQKNGISPVERKYHVIALVAYPAVILVLGYLSFFSV